MTHNKFHEDILAGIPVVLPEPKPYDTTVSHAPKRKDILSAEEKVLAIRNALRYFPAENHEVLAAEFAQELKERRWKIMKMTKAVSTMVTAFSSRAEKTSDLFNVSFFIVSPSLLLDLLTDDVQSHCQNDQAALDDQLIVGGEAQNVQCVTHDTDNNCTDHGTQDGTGMTASSLS